MVRSNDMLMLETCIFLYYSQLLFSGIKKTARVQVVMDTLPETLFSMSTVSYCH